MMTDAVDSDQREYLRGAKLQKCGADDVQYGNTGCGVFKRGIQN